MINRFGSRGKWHKTGNDPGLLGFLQTREPYCVAAAARFVKNRKGYEHAWSLQDEQGKITALLLHSKGSLFPVFNGRPNIPMPHFIERFLRKTRIHSVQGIRREAELLEAGMAPFGLIPVERIEYDLMALDRYPNSKSLNAGPRKLILDRPNPSDIDALFQLQAAYEQEEVLPTEAVFNPAVCRMTLEHIIAHEQILIAKLEGRILGKINTNAASFSRYQIGGVYVLPEYRRVGIASCLTAAFVRDIITAGKGVTLFVKKRNLAARSVYRRIGFVTLDDYRISYY
ncbi:MAG: GNAT family N-acetyltransferase [Treponema sp.]|jgi:GNAT superfamily N-acetyltransferase|nr:GNAT family N-acetyltransferase [Treponema sp.]